MLANAALQRTSIILANSFFGFSVYPTFFGSEIAFSPEDEMLFSIPSDAALDRIESIATTADTVTRLAKTSKTEIVICVTENPGMSSFNPVLEHLDTNRLNRDRLVDKLIESLPPSQDNISVIVSKAETMAALKQRHFQTDGHWKISASYDAYTKIAHEFELDPLTPTQTFSFPQYDFIGQVSRVGLFFFESDDCIEDYTLDYPDYEITFNGTPYKRTPWKRAYFDGSVPYAMYGTYFGNNFGGGVFVYRQKEFVEERGNLLFLSDSFGAPLEPMLASHYNETHVIIPIEYGAGFDIENYIAQNNIETIVLTSLVSSYTDPRWQSFFNYDEGLTID